MGDLINMLDRRRQHATEVVDGPWAQVTRLPTRSAAGQRPVGFCFDLASPWTYLAAERVAQTFADVTWTPVIADALHAGTEAADRRRAAEQRAAELRLPLMWPEEHAPAGHAAMRLAAYAAERDRAAGFVLAAGRLAFCGGFDLDDPEILAEAAAAAGLGLEESLAAAGDHGRDAGLRAAGDDLLRHGADRLPALRVGRLLFCGEDQIPAAENASRDPGSVSRRAPRAG